MKFKVGDVIGHSSNEQPEYQILAVYNDSYDLLNVKSRNRLNDISRRVCEMMFEVCIPDYIIQSALYKALQEDE